MVTSGRSTVSRSLGCGLQWLAWYETFVDDTAARVVPYTRRSRRSAPSRHVGLVRAASALRLQVLRRLSLRQLRAHHRQLVVAQLRQQRQHRVQHVHARRAGSERADRGSAATARHTRRHDSARCKTHGEASSMRRKRDAPGLQSERARAHERRRLVMKAQSKASEEEITADGSVEHRLAVHAPRRAVFAAAPRSAAATAAQSPQPLPLLPQPLLRPPLRLPPRTAGCVRWRRRAFSASPAPRRPLQPLHLRTSERRRQLRSRRRRAPQPSRPCCPASPETAQPR